MKSFATSIMIRATPDAIWLTMREDDSGWLAALITNSIPDLQPAFDEFAACLKARVEGS